MKRQSRRTLIQCIAAVAQNAYIPGFLQGVIYQGRMKLLCVPGLNCYSCPGALGACPIGSLQAALSGRRGRFPAYVLGTLVLFGVVLGRLVCAGRDQDDDGDDPVRPREVGLRGDAEPAQKDVQYA